MSLSKRETLCGGLERGKGGQSERGGRVLVGAARCILKKLILKEARSKYPAAEKRDRRASPEPRLPGRVSRGGSLQCKQPVLRGRMVNEVSREAAGRGHRRARSPENSVEQPL